MNAKLIRYQSAEDFLADAGEMLYRDEPRNNLMIGIVERLTGNLHYYGDEDPYLAVVTENDAPVIAASMTPPFNLLLTPFADHAGEFVDLFINDLEESGFPLPGVNAERPLAEVFAKAWAAKTGGMYTLEMAQRTHALRKVDPPSPVEGNFVPAGPEDVELVADWLRAFEVEAMGGESRSIEAALKAAARNIESRNWFLWRVDGKPVSMCLRTRPTRTGCSVSGVYTPAELRGRGYASNCVAALSQHLLDEGYQFTCLFTDLANPTSNHIYYQIGYRPVADFDNYKLSD